MWARILSWITGGGGRALLEQITALRRERANAETEQEKNRLDAEIKALEQERQDRESARDHSRSMVNNPILIYPIAAMVSFVAIYFGAIVIDSVFLHTGGVQQMPGFAQDWAEAIIYAVFGPVSGGVGIGIAARMFRR